MNETVEVLISKITGEVSYVLPAEVYRTIRQATADEIHMAILTDIDPDADESEWTAALHHAAAIVGRFRGDSTGTPLADHPHTDPGDGRSQCGKCGKWVWPVTHSCKGVRVASPAEGGGQ